MQGFLVYPRSFVLFLASALPLVACAASPTAEDPAGGVGGAAGQGGSAGAGQGGSAGAGGKAEGGSGGAEAGSGGDAGGGLSGGGQGGQDAGGGGQGGESGSSGQAGGPPLTGPVLPAGPCTDSLDAVYQTPSGLAPLTDEGRGDVVRCAPDVALDMAAVQKELMGKSLNDVTATTGLNLVRVAYRTRRAAGVDGVSTARVYLPTTPRPAPLPVIVIAHPSDGLADNCAPSKDAASLQDLALPWAARGYAVIATDYAGLGNEGTQGYLDNHDQAYSVLDSARALRKLLPAGWLSSKAMIAGHSQGGGAALSAQALASSYGLDADLTAVTVFAPEWPSRLNSFGFVSVLRNPDTLTILSGITKPVVIPSLVYAYGRNHAPDALVSLFPPGKESGLGTAEESMCLQQFGAYIQSVAVHQRDLVSDELRTTFLACVDGKPECAEPGKGLHDYMNANLLTPDPKGAPVLYSQGLLDTIMPPNEEAACNLARLKTAGVDTTVCTDKTGIHTNIVVDSIVFSMKWAEAALGDLARPTCDGGGMPACLP